MVQKSSGSPKFAIPQRVANIALRYGETVSKGIQEMQRRIIDIASDGDKKHE